MLTSEFFQIKLLEYPTASAPHELAAQLATETLTVESRQEIIRRYGLERDKALTCILVDWVIEYVRALLTAAPLAIDLDQSVAPIKLALGIEEADFLAFRAAEIKEIMCTQLELILADSVIDTSEELAQLALQSTFGLGYDKYLALTRPLYEQAREDTLVALAQAPPEEAVRLNRRVAGLRTVYELAISQPRSLGGLR